MFSLLLLVFKYQLESTMLQLELNPAVAMAELELSNQYQQLKQQQHEQATLEAKNATALGPDFRKISPRTYEELAKKSDL